MFITDKIDVTTSIQTYQHAQTIDAYVIFANTVRFVIIIVNVQHYSLLMEITSSKFISKPSCTGLYM